MDFNIDFLKDTIFMLLPYLNISNLLIKSIIFQYPFLSRVASNLKKKIHIQKREKKAVSKMLQRGDGNSYLWSVWLGDQLAYIKRDKKQALNLHDEMVEQISLSPKQQFSIQ